MHDRQRIRIVLIAILSLGCTALTAAIAAAESPQRTDAQQPAEASTPGPASQADTPAAAPAAPAEGTTPGIVRVAKDYDLWIDPKQKLVIVDGQVCLREGVLEMFACPKGSKEHESIVSVNCKAQFVHAALMAVEAQPGKPVSFDPVYRPASGPIVEVYVLWQDEAGKKCRVRAQEWIKELKSEQPMSHRWVFAGSGFWTDPSTGERFYQADGGEFICVSNFPTAMLDLPIKSTQTNESLLFAAFTERIPPLGTKVRLVLIPESEKKKAGKAEKPVTAKEP